MKGLTWKGKSFLKSIWIINLKIFVCVLWRIMISLRKFVWRGVKPSPGMWGQACRTTPGSTPTGRVHICILPKRYRRMDFISWTNRRTASRPCASRSWQNFWRIRPAFFIVSSSYLPIRLFFCPCGARKFTIWMRSLWMWRDGRSWRVSGLISIFLRPMRGSLNDETG